LVTGDPGNHPGLVQQDSSQSEHDPHWWAIN